MGFFLNGICLWLKYFCSSILFFLGEVGSRSCGVDVWLSLGNILYCLYCIYEIIFDCCVFNVFIECWFFFFWKFNLGGWGRNKRWGCWVGKDFCRFVFFVWVGRECLGIYLGWFFVFCLSVMSCERLFMIER